MTKTRDILVSPIFNNNPITVQILGICSALAVSPWVARSWGTSGASPLEMPVGRTATTPIS